MAAFFGADEIWNRRTDDAMETVVLAGVRETAVKNPVTEEEFLHSLMELEELAKACGMNPVSTLTQQLPRATTGLYVGTGKAEEIRSVADMQNAERAIFNDTLSPSQIRNLQKALGIPIMDRTALILEIFDRRARTREARLQVELARLKYLKPRLIGMWETQNRQGGASGAMSAKGEGETQLEIDRRTIDHRLSELKSELKEVSTERDTQRKKRRTSGLPLVALIGYTNAGKSTIMNAMLDRFAAPDKNSAPDGTEARKVFEADMLFATLDTTIRRITVERGKEFLLSDTVGFIHKLPTMLIEAFQSTLEEVKEADLLLQVVDGHDPFALEHIEVTKKTIEKLGAAHIPMITVFNKADLTEPSEPYPRRGLTEETASGFRNESVYISAKDPASIEFLTESILDKLLGGYVERDFLIPYADGRIVSFLMDNAVVTGTEYKEEGTLLSVKCSSSVALRIDKMLEGR